MAKPLLYQLPAEAPCSALDNRPSDAYLQLLESSGMWSLTGQLVLLDELWEIIASLIPPEPSKPKGGHPRISDRKVLTGILFVLRTGIPWELLPQEMGCGSGMTCWRRLRDWQEAGVW